MDSPHDSTLEFFGTTTFRLRTNGITIFHDTWLDRPAPMPTYLAIDDITEADYIFISHAHFDHLPGADKLAIRTGATVIANCEAINSLRKAGVPEEQLLPVSGGERIPLFKRQVIEDAIKGTVPLAVGVPGAPPRPHSDLATISVHVWPSLHSLIPGAGPHDIPEEIDSGKVYLGSVTKFDCTLDITRIMKHGLFRFGEILPPEEIDDNIRSFIHYISDRQKNIMSFCDGGQLMFNVIIGTKAVLFNSHLGAYDGILQVVEPKPNVAVLGIGGRGNLNGRPFDGSAAQFAVKEAKLLGEPEKIIWSLYDESIIKPLRVNTSAATDAIHQETRSKIVHLEYAKPYNLFE